MSEEKKPKPIRKFRCGQITADVWENKAKDDTKFLSVSVAKNYKDADDKWQTSNSYSLSDLHKLNALIRRVSSELNVFEIDMEEKE